MGTIFIIILTASLTAILIHIFAESRDRLVERNRAAFYFRNCFSKEFEVLSPHASDDIGIPRVLKYAFPRHETALKEFKLFLNESDCEQLDRVWEAYCRHDTGEYPYFDQYQNETEDVEEGRKNRALALERLQNLMNFAAPKKHWLSVYSEKFKNRFS